MTCFGSDGADNIADRGFRDRSMRPGSQARTCPGDGGTGDMAVPAAGGAHQGARATLRTAVLRSVVNCFLADSR